VRPSTRGLKGLGAWDQAAVVFVVGSVANAQIAEACWSSQPGPRRTGPARSCRIAIAGEQRLAAPFHSDWCVCMPEPFVTENNGFGMNVAALPAGARAVLRLLATSAMVRHSSRGVSTYVDSD